MSKQDNLQHADGNESIQITDNGENEMSENDKQVVKETSENETESSVEESKTEDTKSIINEENDLPKVKIESKKEDVSKNETVTSQKKEKE